MTYYKSYVLWAVASLFYLYQFVLRLSPSVMMEDLMEAFTIDATGFAALGSIALLSYSLFQIPLGAFADRFGVRKCILVFLTVCIVGTFIFATAPNLWIAQFGRFMIGMGSAAAFLSVGKIINQCFPEEKRATLFGLTMAVGTVGALNGGLPLCYLLELVGWSHCLLMLCLLGLVLLTVSYFTLSLPESHERHERVSSFKSLTLILKNKECWTYALTAIGLYLAICVFGDLWGVAYIMKAYGIERAQAVPIISMMYVGLCVGSITITWISDRLGKARSFIIFSTIMLLILLSLVIAPLSLPFEMLYLLFFLIGFFAGAEMLCFSGACKAVSSSIAGITTGFLNGLVMIVGAGIQMGVGIVLDALWKGSTGFDGIKIYDVNDYRIALSLTLPILLLALFSSLFIKEKKSLTLNLNLKETLI